MGTTKPTDVAWRPSTTGIECLYLPEPLLVFGDGGQHVNPKSGIARYGPLSYAPLDRHPGAVRVGIVGTSETIEKVEAWLESNARGVSGDARHPEFPGFQGDRGFFSTLQFDQHWLAQITHSELDDLLKTRHQRDRFTAALQLLEAKLQFLAEQDQAPDYVVVGLPDSLTQRCEVAEYRDPVLGLVHRNLRRAFKALAMKYRIPTQILRQRVMDGRDRDHPSKIAWNFFTGLYFKAGGTPWGPVGLSPGTCYVGISFYRPLGSMFERMQTSLVQAFDEHGQGLVLRGHDFDWDSAKEGSRSPHLTEDQAEALIELVLTRYQQEMNQNPARVVVHKTSRYWPAERSGFQRALSRRVSRYDLLALQPQSEVRLITTSKYPPLRGTRFSAGDLDFLYTTGFVAELGEFHGLHVPSPLLIADHVGRDTAREQLLREVLILTKMNFNSSRLGGLMPITVNFSRRAGEIMREVPPDREPLPQFKFYV